jgi:hypothetical protein
MLKESDVREREIFNGRESSAGRLYPPLTLVLMRK